ncbi:MAG: Fic family protein [Rhodocyclaceae bacterium]|nr:Fic family protein [Rhodocyclaceae bacterium]
MDNLLEIIGGFPQGASPKQIMQRVSLSRPTLNRRLVEELARGTIVVKGRGPATRYTVADPLAAQRAYFDKPYTERIIARYREELLEFEPGLSEAALASLGNLPPYSMDKRALGKFLIDFSCASSVLEGGTYSMLDTLALIEYGEKAAGKPIEDAFLVLNHKEAFEFLHDNPRLDSIFRVHDLLTNDHDLPQLQSSRHFLTKPFRGVPREHTDVDIALSSYVPPFRPGTGYVGKMLGRILDRAASIANPVQAAFYLLTRIPYLQPFQDGNKRTSRAMCNVPLLQSNLPAVSFVDFGKRDYIVSMIAFYELGDVMLAEACFVDAYNRSIGRLGIKH